MLVSLLLKVAVLHVWTAPGGLPTLCLSLFGRCALGLAYLKCDLWQISLQMLSPAAHVIIRYCAPTRTIGLCCLMQMKHTVTTYQLSPSCCPLLHISPTPGVKWNCHSEGDPSSLSFHCSSTLLPSPL